MLGEENISIDEIPNMLDGLLQSSLLQRRLNRHQQETQALFKSVLEQRGRHIWSLTTTKQRKGYYLAGVGLATGQKLDEAAPEGNVLLIEANAYIDAGKEQEAITVIIKVAELLFAIPPFTPIILPDDWREIMTVWLKGNAVRDQGFNSIDDTLRFVEDGLVYRLPWGLEALRVRAKANDDIVYGALAVDDFEVGLVVPAIENGSLNISAAMLMQAGFSSRLEAINSIKSTGTSFSNRSEFKEWLSSEKLTAYISLLDLIGANTAKLWKTFINEYKPKKDSVWKGSVANFKVNWEPGVNAQIGQLIKLHNEGADVTKVLSSDGEVIGKLRERYKLLKNGIYRAQVSVNNLLHVTYWGAGESPFKIT